MEESSAGWKPQPQLTPHNVPVTNATGLNGVERPDVRLHSVTECGPIGSELESFAICEETSLGGSNDCLLTWYHGEADELDAAWDGTDSWVLQTS